jgi:hypothetical protein
MVSFVAKAQLGYDYAQYDFGVGAGANVVYGDAETLTARPAIHLNLTFNQTPFVNYTLEAQIGQMAGGNAANSLSGRQFTSDFSSYQFRVQLQQGEFIDYSRSAFANVMKNFYVATGVGIIYTNITGISRYSYLIPDYYTGGTNNANQVFLPLRTGYEFKIFNSYNEPSFKIDIGYEYNFVFGDELDGFKAGKKNDAFAQIYFGVKFALGGVTSYRKQIYR